MLFRYITLTYFPVKNYFGIVDSRKPSNTTLIQTPKAWILFGIYSRLDLEPNYNGHEKKHDWNIFSWLFLTNTKREWS